MKFVMLVAAMGCVAAQKPEEEPFEFSGPYTGEFTMGSGSVTYDFPLIRSCSTSKVNCGTVAYPQLSVVEEIIMFNNAKCLDRSWWAGPDAGDVCTYFVEEFRDTVIVSTAPDGSYASVGMAPQRDGSLLWNYFNGMERLEAAFLYPNGMAKNEAKDEALRAEMELSAGFHAFGLPAWNPALNGVYEGMAENPVNPIPYAVILELNVTDSCENCGSVSYPSQGLYASMVNLLPVDLTRLPELKGPNGTGRCWQLNEDYSEECVGTDAGWATSPVVVCEQTDSTLQWNMLWGKPEIAIVSTMVKTDIPVQPICPGGDIDKCRWFGCSTALCAERC